ncbi:MAG: hypothetical protein ACTHWA_02410 [Arachnia sp.]
MAEVRKHNPDDGDALGKLVRDALGDQIRPHAPGQSRGEDGKTTMDEEEEATGPTASSLPSWPSDSPGFTF